MVFSQYETCGSRPLASSEIESCGTLDDLYPEAEARGYKVLPSGKGQFQNPTGKIDAQEIAPIDGVLTHQHIRNFLDCVKSRGKCNRDLEIGHRPTNFAHFANLALSARSRIEWDPKKERVRNNEKLNQSLQYDYRVPWKF